MRYRALATLFVAIAFAVLATGCGNTTQSVPIEPLPAGQDRADFGLGPGVRPLSFGPGDKSAPAWSPTDERIAFVVDGYVVDKSLYDQDLRRWTTRDFGASRAEWRFTEGLTIFADNPSPDTEESGAVYRTLQKNTSFAVEEIATGAWTMSPGPGGKGLIVALETSPYESGLARIGVDGKVNQLYTNLIGGRVTGLSLSPDGGQVAVAARGAATVALYVLDLKTGESKTIARLDPGMEIHGDPQWTDRGIYYVAGEEDTGKRDVAPQILYRMPMGASPEPAPGIGEDFVASSLRVSPDGKRIAIVGRRNPTSSTNLYILDLATDRLEAVTTNENMEIKTGPYDLAWSTSGDRVAIVARGVISGPRVLSAPADTLLTDFYNLYEVPVKTPGERAS